MKLTKYEKETIFNYNQGDDTAYIYTCSKALMRHMEKILNLEPTAIYSYGREYECPKAWIRKPKKTKKLSESHKQKLRQRLSQKSILREISS
jgi:hypothetical protein